VLWEISQETSASGKLPEESPDAIGIEVLQIIYLNNIKSVHCAAVHACDI